jgi:hypothetical protein
MLQKLDKAVFLALTEGVVLQVEIAQNVSQQKS